MPFTYRPLTTLLALWCVNSCPFAGKSLRSLKSKGIVPPNDHAHRRLQVLDLQNEICTDHSAFDINNIRCQNVGAVGSDAGAHHPRTASISLSQVAQEIAEEHTGAIADAETQVWGGQTQDNEEVFSDLWATSISLPWWGKDNASSWPTTGNLWGRRLVSEEGDFDEDDEDAQEVQAASSPSCICPGKGDSRDNYQSYDGLCNNKQNPTWGSAHTPMVRRVRPSADTSGVSWPNPRAVSQAVFAQDERTPPSAALSSMTTLFGQFLDHDITLTQSTTLPAENRGDPGRQDIPVPAGDPLFDPEGTGTATIAFVRTGSLCDGAHLEGREVPEEVEAAAGGRMVANEISAFIDGSNVYGSSREEAGRLREPCVDGTGHACAGRLRTSPSGVGSMLPLLRPTDPGASASVAECSRITDDVGGQQGEGEGEGDGGGSKKKCLFDAGDGRANEQPGLTALHTLFVRYHNWQAARVHAEMEAAFAQPPQGAGQQAAGVWEPLFANRGWRSLRIFAHTSTAQERDEAVFQEARRHVVNSLQKIAFEHFLPALTGRQLPRYKGYKKKRNPGVALEFASSAFRFGHSLVNEHIRWWGEDHAHTDVSLVDSFARPEMLADEALGGVEAVIVGSILTPAQQLDAEYVPAVQDRLFGDNLDLGALNIARGREVGLPSYADVWRKHSGKSRPKWSDVAGKNSQLRKALKRVYGSPRGAVESVDLQVGMLAEDHVEGGQVGPTLRWMLEKQFRKLRDGDRWYYEKVLSSLDPERRSSVHVDDLADILRKTATDEGRTSLLSALDTVRDVFRMNTNGNEVGGTSKLWDF